MQFISEVGVLFNDFGDIEQVIPGQANEKDSGKETREEERGIVSEVVEDLVATMGRWSPSTPQECRV